MQKSGHKNIAVLMLIVVAGALVLFMFLRRPTDQINQKLGEYSFTSSTGKTIIVKDTHPENANLSTVFITTNGFRNNIPVTLRRDKLTDVSFSDLNGDSFEELVLIFSSQTDPYYGEVAIFTTFSEESILEVEVPSIEDENMLPGEIFEGYIGRDFFLVEKNRLFRTFLTEQLEVTTEETVEEIPATEEEVITEDDVTEEDEALSTSEEMSPDEATTTSSLPQNTKEKKIVYIMVGEDGLFSMEPQKIDSAKVYTASSTAALPSTSWKWLSLTNKGDLVAPPDDTPLLVSFMSDNTFTASTTCEAFTGGYVVSGYVLRLGSLVTTTQAEGVSCPAQNATLKELLPLAESFVIRDDQLIITLEGKQGVILFTRQ